MSEQEWKSKCFSLEEVVAKQAKQIEALKGDCNFEHYVIKECEKRMLQDGTDYAKLRGKLIIAEKALMTALGSLLPYDKDGNVSPAVEVVNEALEKISGS